MNARELEQFFDDVIRAEQLEGARMDAALIRDERASVDNLKLLQNLLVSLSNRARKELGLPSVREELRSYSDG